MCARVKTYLGPSVAFEIDEELFRYADDVQPGSEAIHVDSVMAGFDFVAVLTERLQLQGRCRLAVARYRLDTFRRALNLGV